MTELNCALMDAEPTLSAQVEDETQSLHAWSQEDTATEVVDYRPRSWKIPALAAALAAIALTAGVFLAWPESATKQQVAPASPQVAAKQTIPSSPPVQAQSPDQRFIALLDQRGVDVVSPLLVVNGGHKVCTDLANGYSATTIAEAFVRSTPNTNIRTQAIFVQTAQEVYCPPAAS